MSQDEDLDSDLDVCLLDDVSSETRKNMSDVPDEDLSDDLLQSDEEEQIMSHHDTVDSSQITSHLKTPCNSQEVIVRETIRESPFSPVKETVVALKGTQGPQGRNISGQDEKRVRSCTAGVTAAEELGDSAGDQESEDEAVDVEINEPFDHELQVSQVIEIKEHSDLEASLITETTKECWEEEEEEEEEEESNEEDDDDDEQPCHSRLKSERKEGMMVVRLSDGARLRRNIPDTLDLSEGATAALKDCKTGAKQPASRPAASDTAWGRGAAGGREQSSRMEVRGSVRGFEEGPPHPTKRPSVQPPPPPPSYQRPRPPQQRYFNQPQSFAQPSHQVPLMSAQSQAKPAVAPQCLSGAAALGTPRFPQPPGSQHAEPWRGQAPPKERSYSEPQVPGQHMLDQWRCPRLLDCNPRFPLQSHKRPPPPPTPRPRTEPWPRQGQGLEPESGPGPGPGTGGEQGIAAGLGQPLGGRREPLRSRLPLPPPQKVAVVLNSGPHLSRPLLLQGQPSPRPCTPSTDQPPATPCVSVHPARSKVSPSFTMATAPAPAEAAPTQPQPQAQPPARRQPRPHFPGLSGTGPPEHVRKDVCRPTPAPAAQVRPISRAEQSAKPVVVARGVPATAVPATAAMPKQCAKAEPAASAAPEPRTPTRNVGQKVKEEPPSPALRAQRAPAKACVQAEEEEDEEARGYREKMEEQEDEETRVYREKMEEQKRKRAEVVRQKELRRQQQAKEKQKALQKHKISQSHVDQQRLPRSHGPAWGQGWGAHPYQQGQREGVHPNQQGQRESAHPYQQGQREGVHPNQQGQREGVHPNQQGQREGVHPNQQGQREGVHPNQQGQREGVHTYQQGQREGVHPNQQGQREGVHPNQQGQREGVHLYQQGQREVAHPNQQGQREGVHPNQQGQREGVHPNQQGQREGPPWQFDTRDTCFQGPCNMGPAHFREEQRDEQFPRGPSSFHHSQRGPPQSWTDRLQEPGVQHPQQQSQQRQWGIQHHMLHQNQPHARFTPANFASDTGPRSIHGLGSHQPQSQTMPPPPPPLCFQERLSPVEPPSDRFTSGPWARLAPDEQGWFQPPEVWSPPGEWRPQTLQQQQPWMRVEEQQAPMEPIRPTLKRVFAQRGDSEDEVPSPLKVIRQIIQHVRAEEEHSAQCFSTRDDVVKHEDNRNVTRLITVGRSLQPHPAEMLNMDMDEEEGLVCATHEHTGLCRRCTNSLPNSNLVVKINY